MVKTRLNNEKKIDNENFKLKIGTTNKLSPVIVYIEGKAFITPNEERYDYSKDISEMKHCLRRSIGSHLSETNLFDNKFILDFQVATGGIKMNKKSFLSFQFYLRQDKDDVKKLTDLKNNACGIINEIVNELSDCIVDHGFEIAKTKK